MSKKEVTILFVLALVQFTNIMDFMIIMPLGPQLMRLFDITPQQFSFLVSAYTITAGIVGFVFAFLLDRFDRKTFLFIAYLGFTAGTLACGLSPTYLLLLLSRVLTGCFGGMLAAIVWSIIGDVFTYERRARAMSWVMASFSLAAVIGVPTGLLLAAEFNWHVPFFVLAGLGAVILALIYFLIPSMKGHLHEHEPGNPVTIITEIFSDANMRTALLFMALLMLGQFSVVPFIAPYLDANIGFTGHQLSYLYFFGGLATVITSPIIGHLADKHGKHRVYRLFALISIIPMLAITNLPRMNIVFVLLITTFFFIVVSGRGIPASTLVTSAAPSKRRGSFMSINSSTMQFSSGIASLMSGMIVQKSADGLLHHYNIIGYLAVGFTLLSIWLSGKIKAGS
jgi:predicted MFS family arabinose efflux permease